VTDGAIDVHPLREGELEAVCSHLPGRSRTQHLARLEEQRRGRFVYLIAWVDGVPAGHVGVGFPDDRRVVDLCEWGDRALVSDLWVEPAFRGRGAGRALMLELEFACGRAGVRGIGLDSGLDEGYAAARDLYRSLGYFDEGGTFITSSALPADAGLPYFVEFLTIWTKSLPG
jgi:GNAT superfamily N-acetyltransferase